MILSVNKLKSALQIIAPAFQGSKQMTILEFVTIEADGNKVKLTGTNLRETIIHSYTDEEQNKSEVILIEYVPFMNYIKLNSNALVELKPELKSKTSNIVNIHSGSAKVKLPGENPNERLNVEVNQPEKEFSLDASLFTEAYKRCFPFAAKDDLRLAMSSIRFSADKGNLIIESCSGTNLARLKMDIEDEFYFLIDKSIKSVSDLFHYGNVDVKISSNKIEIANESTSFIGMLIDERFPDTDAVINNLPEAAVSKINKSLLLDELKRAEQFANADKSFSISFKPKQIAITAEYAEMDMFYENQIEAECFTDFEIKTVIDVFIKAVSLCEGDIIEIHHHNDYSKPVIIKDTESDYFALLMPVR